MIVEHKHSLGNALILIGVSVFMAFSLVISPLTTSNINAYGSLDIIDETNKYRDIMGLEDLVSNPKLMNVAQLRADDMAENKYFSHTAPNGDTAFKYLKNVGYKYSSAGENLAITNESAPRVLQAWKDSPEHNLNLLNDKYKEIGVGIAYYGDYEGQKDTQIIVAVYGEPYTSDKTKIASINVSGTLEILKSSLSYIPKEIYFGVAISLVFLGIIIELAKPKPKK